MAERARTRTPLPTGSVTLVENGIDYPVIILDDQYKESMTDFTNGKSRPASKCRHYRLSRMANGELKLSDTTSLLYKNVGSYNDGVSLFNETDFAQFVDFGKLDFQRNNSLEIIPAIFDLDGTIAMFTRKFWKHLTYGSVNWALLPFFSDVKSLYNTTQDLFGRIGEELEQVKRKEKTFPVHYISPYGHRLNGTLRLDGQLAVNTPPEDALNALGILADEIGLNPDLKTVWDVIPLSFVVDYFAPVGDTLESLHPRGWFKPTFTFQGVGTFKGYWSYNYGTPTNCIFSTGTIFERYFPVDMVTNSYQAKQPDWESPSLRELFNTAYLRKGIGGQARRIGKL